MSSNTLKNKKFILAIVLMVLLVGIGKVSSQSITLTSQTVQVIDGFGLSDSWSGGDIMNNVSALERDQVMNRFFSQTGAGLTIVRNRLVEDTNYDFTGQLKFCRLARTLGANDFWASIWNPPGYCLNTQGKVVSANFSNYAQYIIKYVKAMADSGIQISKIGVQNEPDIGGTSYYGTPNDLRDFSIYLRQQLDNNQMTGVRLMDPEGSGWEHSRDFLQAQLSTAQGVQAIDIFATHDYWGAERDSTLDPVRDTVAKWAVARGKHIWETEYSRYDCFNTCSGACSYPKVSTDPDAVMTQPAVNIGDGLTIANFLYKDLSRGNVSGWLYWWTHNPNRGCDGHNSFNGLVILKPDTTFFYPKRFFAVSHYSRFIRPGSLRLVLNTSSLNQLHPVAFWDTVKKNISLVMYNNGTAGLSYTINFSSVPQFSGYRGVRQYLTSGDLTVNVAENDSRTLNQGQAYSSTLPGNSIETVVFSLLSTVGEQRPSKARGEGPGITIRNGRVFYRAIANENVALRIFDISGRMMAEGARRLDRTGDFAWDCTKPLAPGIYLLQIATPRGTAIHCIRL